MVKFKMKLIVILAVSLGIAITMIFYANDLTMLNLFSIQNRNADVLYSESSSVDNVINYGFVWKGLKRNPVLDYSIINKSQDTSQKLLVPLPNNVTRKFGLYQSKNSIAVVKKDNEVNDEYRPVNNLESLWGKHVNFVNNFESELVSISGAAVTIHTIDHLIDNKTNLGLFKSRRDTMLTECSKMYNESSVLKLKKEKLEHIIVDEKNKVLFCYIPKVACTNWKRMFILLSGKSNNFTYVTNLRSYEIHAKNMLPSLQNYSNSDIDFFIRTCKKIIFVRNPLERLLSAYRNKLEQHYNSSKYFQARFGRYIVKNFRKNPSNESLLRGDDVTFSEFVRYLISSTKEQYNEHWQTMNDLCHPCFMKYDIIGKYETIESDAQAMLEMFNVNWSFPSLPKPSRTASSLKDYYGQLSPELIENLYLIYQKDFRLFDYSSLKL